MTEYEIADLAASNTSNLIDIGSMIQVQISSTSDAIQQFMTIMFSYIAAAYLAGAKMGKRQIWVLSTLYILWQLWTIAAVVSRGVLLGILLERFVELGGQLDVLSEVPLVLRSTSAVLLFSALFASLYFMWGTRHPKAE